jgi:hypothetical protein
MENLAVDAAVQGLPDQSVSERRARDACGGEERGEILELFGSIDIKKSGRGPCPIISGSQLEPFRLAV